MLDAIDGLRIGLSERAQTDCKADYLQQLGFQNISFRQMTAVLRCIDLEMVRSAGWTLPTVCLHPT